MASSKENLCWTRSEIVSKSSLGIPLAKASNSSRIRALGVQNTRLESLRNQPEIVPKASNRSRIRGKCVRNTSHKNYRTLPLESIKNNSIALRHRKKQFDYLYTRSEIISKSSLGKRFRTPQTGTLVWNRADIISKFGFGKRFRKPRTAAGFVPKACKTQARKTLETSPTEPTKRKEKR